MELKDLIALMEAAKKNEIDKFVYETETEKIVIRKKTEKNILMLTYNHTQKYKYSLLVLKL